MLPSTRRGTLLYVSDRVGHTEAFADVPTDSVMTRSMAALGDDGEIPAAEWVVIDADILDATPPPWLDSLTGDVYVLAPTQLSVPDWVDDTGLPVLDPTLARLVASATTPEPGDGDADATAAPLDDSGFPDATAAGPAGNGSTPDPLDDASADAHSTAGSSTVDRIDSLSAVPFPVALLDGDGVVRLVNPAWEEFGVENGRDTNEVDVGTSYFDACERADDRFAAAAAKAIRRVIDGESTGERVEYPCHGQHEKRWFSMGVIPLEADPVRAAVVHYDVSHYKQRINVLDRVLRHNLRNKANIILGHAAALASARDDETATAATTIGAAARELLSLSEQARRYREVSTDDRPTTPIDVVSVISEVTERLSDRHPRAVIETSLPAVAVVQGTQSLSLVVHELVENAIVHNDSADPWVRVEVIRVHEGGDERVSVRVVDDGPGIPEQDRRLLTGGLEEHPIRHGSQLGVWVVSSLVTSLDGNVTVEPRTPRGSVVTTTFPSVTVED
jgi:signal transduction histidine kinase